MRAPARRDPRHLRLVEDLVGPDPVRPDAGRVDDVRGLDLDRRRRSRRTRQTTPPARPSRSSSAVDLEPVRHRPPRTARPRRGSSGRGGRRRSGSRRTGTPTSGRAAPAPGSARRPPRRGSSGAGRATSCERSAASSPSSRRPRRSPPLAPRAAVARHHVVHVQPDPDLASRGGRRRGSGPGTASDRRDAARAGPSAVARATPRGRGRGRSSAGSEGRRGPSSRSGSRSRSPSRRARRSPSSSRARRRRARRRRRSRRRRSRRRRRARRQAPRALGLARSRSSGGAEPDEADAEQCGQAAETAEQDRGRRRLELVLGVVGGAAVPRPLPRLGSSPPAVRPGCARARRRWTTRRGVADGCAAVRRSRRRGRCRIRCRIRVAEAAAPGSVAAVAEVAVAGPAAVVARRSRRRCWRKPALPVPPEPPVSCCRPSSAASGARLTAAIGNSLPAAAARPWAVTQTGVWSLALEYS